MAKVEGGQLFGPEQIRWDAGAFHFVPTDVERAQAWKFGQFAEQALQVVAHQGKMFLQRSVRERFVKIANES